MKAWEKASGFCLRYLLIALAALSLSGCGKSVFFNPRAQVGNEQRDLTLVGIRPILFVAFTAIVRLSLPGPRVVNEAAEAAFEEMMDFWVPLVFGPFKLLELCTCMFLAIKSHYDEAKKEKEKKEEMKGP